MSAEVTTITTPRGEMPVHLYRPEDAVNQRLVVLFMDAPGIRPVLHGHAERLAKAGYTVAMPDLWYACDPEELPRLERLAAGDANEFARMAKLVGALRDEHVIEDTALMLDAVGGSSTAPWGCVGFCMGGRFGLRAAELMSEGPAAASLLHPSRLVTDDEDSPHRTAGQVEAALYLGYGEEDHVTPLETIPPMESALQQGGVSYAIDILPGADHGFMMNGMPAYNEQAAERAWGKTFELFDAHLAAS